MHRFHYTSSTIDRAERFRGDPSWQRSRLADAATRVFPLWRGRVLVSDEEAPRAVALTPAHALLDGAQDILFLGVDAQGRACFAADLSAAGEAELAGLAPGARFVHLRRVGFLLDGDDGAFLARAHGLAHWHRVNRFCGVCGAATESRDGGHSRICRDGACGAQHFPRTDPAVIMLVTRRDAGGQCLLARQARWPKGMMSTLAGFVELGETLEQAVMREIEEETGIETAMPRYRGSQPWPFPASLMLGFRAEAPEGAELRVNLSELEDARWFNRDEIRARRAIGLILPGRDSIARRLIEEWVDEEQGGQTAQTEEAQRCPAW